MNTEKHGKPMKTLIAMICLLTASMSSAETTITYQGQLQDGSGPYTGTADMTFELYDNDEGGTLVAGPLVKGAVDLVDGLFKVELDFGDAYEGARWLEIEIDGSVLEPRQRISSVPVAVRALNVSDGGTSEDGWLLGGNTGTDPAIDFLGTTDMESFEIHVGAERALRLEPADVANIIAGWTGNIVAPDVIGATIGGGGCPDFGTFPCSTIERPNEVNADFGAIGGGVGNTASGNSATVGGGQNNTASGSPATVGGGWSNTASGNSATVGGGQSNTASDSSATVGGGFANSSNGSNTTVGGGWFNSASGSAATVGGGQINTASSGSATVGGGSSNTASGTQSTVPGGFGNEASGSRSFAAGRQAKASHDGAFVWADNTDSDFSSTGEDQFLIRAGGGVGIGTNSPSSQLHIGAPANVSPIRVQVDGTTRFNINSNGGTAIGASAPFNTPINGLFVAGPTGIGIASPQRDLHIKQSSTTNSTIGLQIERSGTNTNNWAFYIATSDNLGFRYNDELKARINASDGAFVAISDARAKQDIQPLTGALDKVLRLQPRSYSMINGADPASRSIGLIAQEVNELFPGVVSEQDERYGIKYSEITVLNTAALIELNQRQQSEIADLNARIDRLEQLLSADR
jgi:hypothetical protein